MNHLQEIELAKTLVDLLQSQRMRLVLVESCTAGRVSAVLSCIPGVSQWYCGSFVVYRNDSKSKWLGIPTSVLEDADIGPVSQRTSNLLAEAALAKTPEADFAVTVTGDVGPGAPRATDGAIFMTFASRQSNVYKEQHEQLTNPPPNSLTDLDARIRRLEEATHRVLAFTIKQLTVDWLSG